MWLPLVITVQIIGLCVVTSCGKGTNNRFIYPQHCLYESFIFFFFYFSVGQKIDNIQKIFCVEPLDPPTRKRRNDAERE